MKQVITVISGKVAQVFPYVELLARERPNVTLAELLKKSRPVEPLEPVDFEKGIYPQRIKFSEN